MKYLIILFFAACTVSCFAQSFSVPRTSTIRTPYGNARITTYDRVYMPILYGNGQASPKRDFVVVLKSDSTVMYKTRIDVKGKPQSLTVKINKKKRKLVPADTREVYRLRGSGEKVVGIPADSCWLFRAVSGPINGYSNLAEEGYDYVIAIQVAPKGPIVPFTLENLKAMIGVTDDKELKKMLDKKWTLKALKYVNDNF